MAVTEVVFAMMMIVNGSMDGFMKTEGLAHCLKVKRESERNLADNRTNVIRYECGQVLAELEPDSEGVLKIKRYWSVNNGTSNFYVRMLCCVVGCWRFCPE